MKCHYEILGVPLNSTSDELKKAYRKLALEWHPDKNLDRLEEATETFQLIQQAYEILIDPQERAWYDRHRDDILKGGLDSNYKDDCLNVYQYFNTSCFKGYNDEEKGFYTVYRHVFNKISAEDTPFMEEDFDVPEFGCSTSPYDEVVHIFYAYWQSYCTYKSYSWVDKFDLSESRKSGVGRQVIRLMEKENKKIRDQHKKIRNEEVRELVAFVRKRDKRVQAHRVLLEQQKEVKAKKIEEQRRKQIAERKKLLESHQEHEWSSMSQFENHFTEMEANLDSAFGDSSAVNGETEDKEAINDLYCIACDKDFRSVKAMENHENSKKHKENVLFLKATMEEEELENEADEQDSLSGDNEEDDANSSPEDIETSEALLEELIKSSSKSKKKKKKKNIEANEECKDLDATVCDIDSKLNGIKVDDCDTKTSKLEANVTEAATDLETIKDSASDVAEAKKSVSASKKKERKNKSSKSEHVINDDTNSQSDDEKKQTTVCAVCKSDFSSRNKLFDHIKKTGHAAYKTDCQKISNMTDCRTKKQKKLKR